MRSAKPFCASNHAQPGVQPDVRKEPRTPVNFTLGILESAMDTDQLALLVSILSVVIALIALDDARKSRAIAKEANAIAAHHSLRPLRLGAYKLMKEFAHYCTTYRTLLSIGIVSGTNELYEAAKKRCPERWSGTTRNWQPILVVHLNPDQHVAEKEEKMEGDLELKMAA